MPIYAYKCESCGHSQDILQKMSDTPLTDCTQCGAPTFKKQLTAAGFQLKGSGWYVTDFRGGTPTGTPPAQGTDPSTTPPQAKPSDTTPAPSPATSTPAVPVSSTPAAPAKGSA